MTLQLEAELVQVAARTVAELLRATSIIPLDGMVHCPVGNITEYYSTRPSM